MKKTNQFMGQLFLCILFFSLANFSTAQQSTTKTVTLTVNTELVTASNTDQTCNFGQAFDTANRDFTIFANVGDHIVWDAFSSSNPEEDEVKIISIIHEGGTNLFGLSALVDSAQNPGVVVGTITAGKADDIQKYNVVFQVFRKREFKGTYTIDPKIQVQN